LKEPAVEKIEIFSMLRVFFWQKKRADQERLKHV
jgi:hypothetical protein